MDTKPFIYRVYVTNIDLNSTSYLSSFKDHDRCNGKHTRNSYHNIINNEKNIVSSMFPNAAAMIPHTCLGDPAPSNPTPHAGSSINPSTHHSGSSKYVAICNLFPRYTVLQLSSVSQAILINFSFCIIK